MRDAIQRMQLERKLAAVFFAALLLLCAIIQSVAGGNGDAPPQLPGPHTSVQDPSAGAEVPR